MSINPYTVIICTPYTARENLGVKPLKAEIGCYCGRKRKLLDLRYTVAAIRHQ